MTPATASAWVVDRLAEGRAVGAPPRGGRSEGGRRVRSLRCPASPGGDGLTLGQELASVWEGLVADGTAACPLCGGLMEGHGPARCVGCGSELS